MPETIDFVAEEENQPVGIDFEEEVSFEPEEPEVPSIKPPDLSGVKLSPYEKAQVQSMEQGLGLPKTGMEPGTELLTAVATSDLGTGFLEPLKSLGDFLNEKLTPHGLGRKPEAMDPDTKQWYDAFEDIRKRRVAAGEERPRLFTEWAGTPMVRLPKWEIDPKHPGWVNFIKEVDNQLVGLPEFFTSPLGLATIGAGATGKAAQTGLRYAFAAEAANALFNEAPDLVREWNNLTGGEKGQALARVLGSTAMVALLTGPEARAKVTQPRMEVGATVPAEPILRTVAEPPSGRVGQIAPEAIRLTPRGPAVLGAEPLPMPTPLVGAGLAGEISTQIPPPSERPVEPVERGAPAPSDVQAAPVASLEGRIAPEAVTEVNVEQISASDPTRLTHGAGIEYGVNLSEADVPRLEQKYNTAQRGMIEASRAGDNARMLSEFGKSNFYGGALQGATKGKHPAAAGNYAMWLEQQSRKAAAPAEPVAVDALQGRFERITGPALNENAIWSHLKEQHGIEKGIPGVAVINRPDVAYSGRIVIDSSGKPTGIEVNRAKITSARELDWVIQHEASHWFDLSTPGGAAKFLTDNLKPEEWASIDTEIYQARYRPAEFGPERTARAIQTLADAWRGRGWFSKLTGEIMRFASETIGIKMTRAAAESAAVRAVARGVESAKAVREAGVAATELRAAEPAPVGERAMGAAAPVPERTFDWDLFSENLRDDLDAFSPARTTGRIDYDMMDVADRFVEFAKNDTSGKPLDKLVGDFSKVDYGSTTSQIKRLRTSVKSVISGGPSISEKGMGAAVPGEFPEPEVSRTFRAFDGWTGRAKEALQRVKEYFTPPQVGALPEVEIQSGAVLPRLPDYAKEKVIASAPHGMAKMPGLGAIMDTRAVAHAPADAAFLARANSVAKGKTFAALWAQTQWRYKDLFHVEQNPGENQGTFRLTNGRRGYLSDVIEAELRDPGSQPITHAQWQWIHNEWKPLLDEGRRILHNEDIWRISTEDMDFDLSTDYFPRPAIGKRTRATTGAGGRPAGRPGAKQFFQRARKFPTEEEGARPSTPESPKEEIIYDPDPISRVSKWISGIYRAVADHRLANDPALGAGTVPDYWGIGRQTMAGPAFAGKIYPVEVAQKIERQFAQDIRGWVRGTGTLTSAAKALMATADVSAPFIQGAAMFGRHPARWARATVNSYRALTDPNAVAKLMEHPRYKELAEGYSQSGGSLLQLQDFLAGLQEGQIATRIPGYGRFLTATGRSYGAFLDLAKLELFDAWRRVTPQSELPRLVETIENSLFMGRMEQIGLNPHRAIGERLLLFAPSYYRGAAGLISTAFQKGVSGKMARQMLGSYAAASMLVTMSAYLAMGMDWDEIQQRLQPGRGKFLKVPVNLGDDQRIEVGIGNVLTQLVRLAGQAANYHTSDKPIDTGVEANPYLRFLRGRAAFIPGVAIELATGRDYFGNRITIKESLARHFAPFVVQSMFPRDEATLRQRLGDATFTFFGLNAYPESEYEKARNQMDETARKIGGKPFSQLNVAQRARVVAQFKRSPEYKPRDPSPTDMERIININAERQANLQKSLGDGAEKLARVGLRVPGYRSTFRYGGVDVPMTERERQRYQDILSEMYRAQISRLNEAALLRRPLPDREKWWSTQAEKIGVVARKRLMQEIAQNKIR